MRNIELKDVTKEFLAKATHQEKETLNFFINKLCFGQFAHFDHFTIHCYLIMR